MPGVKRCGLPRAIRSKHGENRIFPNTKAHILDRVIGSMSLTDMDYSTWVMSTRWVRSS